MKRRGLRWQSGSGLGQRSCHVQLEWGGHGEFIRGWGEKWRCAYVEW